MMDKDDNQVCYSHSCPPSYVNLQDFIDKIKAEITTQADKEWKVIQKAILFLHDQELGHNFRLLSQHADKEIERIKQSLIESIDQLLKEPKE